MTIGMAVFAAIITVETVLTDGTKTVETAEVPETDGIVRFVWPKEEVPASFTSVTVTPDFATARKGEEGYWVMPNNSFGTYRLDNGGIFEDWGVFMPMFGMKTPRSTYCAIVTGMPYSLGVSVSATNGIYSQSAVFLAEKDIELYEDIRIDYHFLKGDDADYSGIARCYRKYQLDRGAAVPLAEKAKSNTALAYAVTNI